MNKLKVTDQLEFGFAKIIKEKFRIFETRHGWIDYFIAPIITALILLLVYYLKGVYPFGRNTIAYYDMPTNYVPGYSWTWDVLHGKMGIIVSWYSGMLVSALASVGDNIFFPLNLFFLFVTRDSILYTLSILLLIYMVISAFTMSLYYKRHFESTFGTIIAGVLYTFSGYVLQYYTNIFFLNFVVIFPLVVYALERLMTEHKFIMFIFIMSLCSVLNIQLVFMLYIYILFKSYVIFRDIQEEKKGRSLRLLAISIIISLLIACCLQLPNLLMYSGSSRAESTSTFNYLEQMKNVYSQFRRQKQFLLYGSEIAVGLIFLVFLKGKETIRKYSSNISMLFILCIPILHEGITRLWHAGSYNHFPMRFGYMITFECLILVGKFLKEEKFTKPKYLAKIAKLLGVASIPFVAYVLFGFCKGFIYEGIFDLGTYLSYWVYFLTLSFLYFTTFHMETDESKRFTIMSLVMIQAFCGAYGFIAPKDAEYNNFRLKYTRNAIDLKNELCDDIDYTKRLKSDPSDYESNYSAITGQPVFSFWSNGVATDIQAELNTNMAYDGVNNYVMDSGGTVFSDALLGVTRVAGSFNPDEELYVKDHSKERIYNCKYTMPFGLVLNDSSIDDEDAGFLYHNNLFKSVTETKDVLITSFSADDYVNSKKEITDKEHKDLQKVYDNVVSSLHGSVDVNTVGAQISNEDSIQDDNENSLENGYREYTLKIPVKHKKTIYIYANESFEGSVEILVENRPILTDSFITYGDHYYPNILHRGILSLGTFENEDVELTIYSQNESLNNLEIGLLDLDTLQKGIDEVSQRQSLNYEFEKNTMHIVGTTNMSGTLFVPFGYSNGWHAKVNGIKTIVKPIMNNAFISIEVPEGDVDIEIVFRQRGLVLGIILSFVGIGLVFALVAFMKHGGIKDWKYEKMADKVFVYGYLTIVATFFIFMYAIPIYIKMAL